MSAHLDSASAAAAAAAAVNKRKLDDYSSSDEDVDYLTPSRMRKDQSTPLPFSDDRRHHHHHQQQQQEQELSFTPFTSSVTESTRSSSTRLQFFVRTFSHKTLVIHADRYDTVQSVLDKIISITGVPMNEQRLIYRGKQLQVQKTLAECDVQNDAGLQLVCCMKSTDHPQAWRLVDDVITQVFHLCRGTNDVNTITNTNFFTNKNYTITELTRPRYTVIKSRLTEFIDLTPRTDTGKSSSYLQVLLSSSAPSALVTLYMSLLRDNRKTAQDAIQHFMTYSESNLPKLIHMQCAPIVLEFCNLLRGAAGKDDPLYSFCRSSLGSIVEHMLFGIERDNGVTNGGNNRMKGFIDLKDIFPFISELASNLSKSMVLSTETDLSMGPTLSDVCDFAAFVSPLRNSIVMQAGVCHYGGDIDKERDFLHRIFVDLLRKMDMCLKKVEEHLIMVQKGKIEQLMLGWSQHLMILKELNSISKLYQGAEESFWVILRRRKASLCHLIVKFAKRTDDHRWILDHKEVTNFEARRHLAMMMLPDVKDEYEELHEMLIDRSQLLAESFEYIAHAKPDSLRGGLFMEFKNEEATGPGVLREWFFLVGQAIFNQQNALFVACPNDRRRFFPNPASKVDPLHLKYFSFSGRVIALALMHKVQVGVVFDRVFFKQLAGRSVTLEDIRDADPYLYSSCKQILEMDPEIVDQDALGLTFVREVEELGSRKVVELCPDGRSITVTSKNRELYVDLLIQHRFVTSTAEQVTHFAKGFGDIISSPALQMSFFQSLDLEDFDAMLHGSESAIPVEDWKAHTEYKGFKETDPQILWFWKSVEGMSAEQRKVLLFFWTSIKYLPVEGFCGLASRLYIYKTPEKLDHLPSSHTCFYRLCFPAYPSMAVMRNRLGVITQEHVGCSFGTW